MATQHVRHAGPPQRGAEDGARGDEPIAPERREAAAAEEHGGAVPTWFDRPMVEAADVRPGGRTGHPFVVLEVGGSQPTHRLVEGAEPLGGRGEADRPVPVGHDVEGEPGASEVLERGDRDGVVAQVLHAPGRDDEEWRAVERRRGRRGRLAEVGTSGDRGGRRPQRAEVGMGREGGHVVDPQPPGRVERAGDAIGPDAGVGHREVVRIGQREVAAGDHGHEADELAGPGDAVDERPVVDVLEHGVLRPAAQAPQQRHVDHRHRVDVVGPDPRLRDRLVRDDAEAPPRRIDLDHRAVGERRLEAPGDLVDGRDAPGHRGVVGVELEGVARADRVEQRVAGAREPEVRLRVDHPDPGVAPGPLVGHRGGLVGRAVVEHEHLATVGLVEVIEDGEARCDRRGQHVGVVPADREDAEARARGGRRAELGAETGQLRVPGRGGNEPAEHLRLPGHRTVERCQLGCEPGLEPVEAGCHRVEPLDRRPQRLVDRLLVRVEPLDA